MNASLSAPGPTAPAPARLEHRGGTLWLTGLPSSGKSTTAFALAAALRARNARVEVLDGDEVRATLSAGLGFTRADRDVHVARIGFVARLLARHGVLVLVPVIAPYAGARAAVRAQHEAGGVPYAEVHVSTPLEVCVDRDAKGLYAAALGGQLTALTGVDDPYEVPAAPDLRVDTSRTGVAASVTALVDLLSTRGWL